jgi:lipopolysaccharide export system permease protein
MLKQIAVAAAVVALTLTLAIWLTQSLRFVDWIVNRGLPLITFGYIAILTMPLFLSVVLPIALFSAVLFTYNKLLGDSELVVMRAAGCSPLQLARPALMVSVVTMLIGYGLNLYILPTSYRVFKDLQFQIRNAYATVLVQDGVFTPLEDGLMLYVREQGRRGELLGILVQDNRIKNRPITMVAESGTILNGPDGPRIVMANGNRQELNRDDGRVTFLFFDRYTVTLNATNAALGSRQRDATERYIDELLDPPDITDARTRAQFRAEGHQRLTTPLLAPAFTVVALVALLIGSYNRRGQTRRLLAAVGAVMAVQALAIALGNASARLPMIIPLLYLNGLLTILAGLTVLALDRFGGSPPAVEPSRLAA